MPGFLVVLVSWVVGQRVGVGDGARLARRVGEEHRQAVQCVREHRRRVHKNWPALPPPPPEYDN